MNKGWLFPLIEDIPLNLRAKPPPGAPDEDVIFLGFDPEMCHPKNMMITTILVPPPVARPAIMASEGSRCYKLDDAYSVLDDVKCTPKYWKKAKMEMLAKIDNFGPGFIL